MCVQVASNSALLNHLLDLVRKKKGAKEISCVFQFFANLARKRKFEADGWFM
jgi:hypothetical protein